MKVGRSAGYRVRGLGGHASLLPWPPPATKGQARSHLAQGLLPSTSSRGKSLPSGHPILSTTRSQPLGSLSGSAVLGGGTGLTNSACLEEPPT